MLLATPFGMRSCEARSEEQWTTSVGPLISRGPRHWDIDDLVVDTLNCSMLHSFMWSQTHHLETLFQHLNQWEVVNLLRGPLLHVRVVSNSPLRHDLPTCGAGRSTICLPTLHYEMCSGEIIRIGSTRSSTTSEAWERRQSAPSSQALAQRRFVRR